jgi:outer membrane protein
MLSPPIVHMSKRFISFASGLLFLCSVGVAPMQAQIKVGVVNIDKVFSEYYKTKDAEDRINAARESARKEMDERMMARGKLLEEISLLNRDLGDKSLSASSRDENTKRRDDKIAAIQNLEREISEFTRSRETQLRELASNARKAIVDDIMKVVGERVPALGYELVFDSSGNGTSGVAAVLYARNTMDFTGEIITLLNKTKPVAAPTVTPAAKPAGGGKK